MRGTGVNGTSRHIVDGRRNDVVYIITGFGTMGIISEETASESTTSHNLKSEESTKAGIFSNFAKQRLRRRGEIDTINQYFAVYLTLHGFVRCQYRYGASLHQGRYIARFV